MKVDRRVPLVHILRLRRQARDAGCDGLAAYIQVVRSSFARRKKLSKDWHVSSKSAPADPALDAAYEELACAIEAIYAEREEQIQSAFVNWDEDDCTGLYRYYVYLAETLPSLRKEPREILDRWLGEMAREQLPT